MTPRNWSTSTIGTLCEMVKGTSPIMNTSPGRYPLVTTGKERKTADHFQFDCEAVCVPMISSTGHGHASLKRVHYQSGKFALANLLTALIIRTKSDLSYCFLALHLNYFKDQLLVPLMVGAANMSLTISRLSTVMVSFPSLREQLRIVRIMDQVVELQKLRAQANCRTADLIPALFHGMFGDVVTNPTGWPLAPFGEVCECRLGKMLDAKQQTGMHRRPYLRNVNVQWGRFDLSDVLEMDFDDKDRDLFRLRAGDVLICEGGEVGRTAIWNDELPECYFQKALHRARPNPKLAVPEYMQWLMWALSKSNGLEDFTSQATIAHLTGIKLKTLRIPLPTLSLQREFAAHVAEVRAMKAQQAESRRRLDDLFQSLLHRAFRGEL